MEVQAGDQYSPAQMYKLQLQAKACSTRRPTLHGLIELAVLVGLFDVAAPLIAQAIPAFQPADGDRLAFDVASVKVSRPDAPHESNFPLNAGIMYTPNGGRFYATNFPLVTYIVFAYNLLGNQIQALAPQLPRWATTDGFDIEARAAGNPSKDQMR
jgi:hypothetical protein